MGVSSGARFERLKERAEVGPRAQRRAEGRSRAAASASLEPLGARVQLDDPLLRRVPVAVDAACSWLASAARSSAIWYSRSVDAPLLVLERRPGPRVPAPSPASQPSTASAQARYACASCVYGSSWRRAALPDDELALRDLGSLSAHAAEPCGEAARGRRAGRARLPCAPSTRRGRARPPRSRGAAVRRARGRRCPRGRAAPARSTRALRRSRARASAARRAFALDRSAAAGRTRARPSARTPRRAVAHWSHHRRAAACARAARSSAGSASGSGGTGAAERARERHELLLDAVGVDRARPRVLLEELQDERVERLRHPRIRSRAARAACPSCA